MKRFLIYTILIIGGVTIGWSYLPQNVKEKTTAFLGTVLRGDKKEIQEFIGDKILPKDPEEKREVLLGALKENILKIKKQVTGKAGGSFENTSSVQKGNSGLNSSLLKETEDIISKLEGISADASIGGKVVDKITQYILPERKIDLTPEEVKKICEEKK
ncbi:MAG: hypothetical protein Q8R29_00270 [bacterium]|nr:hypothetical protein [bacterium]